MQVLPGSVLVGVSGPGENTAALKFAIQEARALDRGITLAHVVMPPPPPPAGGMTIPYEEVWGEIGHTIVAQAAEELAVLDSSVEVATVVAHGSPGGVLADLSRDASRVVIAHQDVNRLLRFVTGSTAARVAARAHCPVISVPAEGQPAEGQPAEGQPAEGQPAEGSGVLTVGVANDGGPPEVLAAAIAQAKLHGWSTRMVHAWRLPGPYDNLLFGDGSWETASHAALEEAAAAHPDDDVTVQVLHQWPADALVEESRSSAMVVVGRHGRLGPISPRLGNRTRTLLFNAECPVMVVPLAEES